MKISTFSKMINPVYVLIAGAFGGAIPFFMYLWKFPVSTQTQAQQFAHAPTFATWVFLLSILFSAVTIIIIPSWRIFSELYSSVIKENRPWKVVSVLVISAVIYILILIAILSLSSSGRFVDLAQGDFANELDLRFDAVYIYSLLGFFPVMFCIIMIYYMAEIMSRDIGFIKDDKKETLIFIQEYLNYRNLLQVCLITAGIILSLNPIITSAFLQIWKEIGVFTAETFPSQDVIIYGLIFTLLLILSYAPTYIALTNVGTKLRDAKCPLDIDALEDTMKNRKMLDNLLQTNIGITENLKNGIFTLSPLVTGLLASLLGI